MTFITVKWTTEEYHPMIAAGILWDLEVEIYTYYGKNSTPGIS